ncbi:MAG: hypothetical protein KF696_00705 [Planctomycetes bacterium]|nr:hypothetical protein [Planctomycetota bacterium]MCW8134542.1 hypothetical protein [Planctomycetota bacterium]
MLGALAAYCDVPRLGVINRVGDTLNAVRVLDVATHLRLAQEALKQGEIAAQARERLDEGRRSLDLINFAPSIVAAVPPISSYIPPALAPDDSQPGPQFLPAPLTALPGVLMQLNLPPPRTRTVAQPPATFAPANRPAFTSRGPPLHFGS